MKTPTQQVLSYLSNELPGDLRLLEHMVNMESPSLDKTLVDRFARFVGSQFEAIGGAVEYVRAERFGDHMVARFAGAGRKVLLLGHTDTVFSAGEAAKRPFRIDNGKATGPGVFDMKAGILLMLCALRGSIRTSGRLPASVTVLLTSDEEVGSTSSRSLVESEASQAHAVLVLEPSLPGGVLKTARKGVGRFTIKAIGRAAHAGVDPEKGINAIEEISHQVLALQALSNPQSGTTVSVGVIQGGTRSNVVPAEAVVEIDVRISTMEEAQAITNTIRGLRPRLPDARLEIFGAINRLPMERTEDTARLFAMARSVASELGIDLREGSTGGASDGNLTAALGIPTLDGLGAVGDGAHAVSEFVEVASLPERSALLAGLITGVDTIPMRCLE